MTFQPKDKAMDRRSFMRTAALGTAGLALPFGNAGWIARGATLAESADKARQRLIVIFQRGAVDGLSVVVPYRDDGYYQARKSIAINPPGQPGAVLDLDGHFGAHPSLASVMPLWRNKSLAFVHACGSPDPTRSHFDAQIFMETGTPGRSATPDGWMNRLLEQIPGPHSATQAIAFGSNVPRILTGKLAVANVATGKGAGKPLAIDQPDINAAFAKLYGGSDAMSRTFQESQESRRQVMADLSDEMVAADNGAPLPDGFPGDAARLAKMMRQDSSIQLAFLALGGWDTHVNQGNAQGQLAGRLKPLADGLAVLANGLGPSYADTVIVVMSEFGRTVHENGNGGTDHGHGNVMWVMGGKVAGGQVYGDWPTLSTASLYQGRDVAVTTDFRAVLEPVLSRHMGMTDRTLNDVFPGSFPAAAGMGRLIQA
jgi:uncharacterized protein (DUF1501 family)